MSQHCELPKYQCHKIVEGMKIYRIEGNILHSAEPGVGPVEVTKEYMARHAPYVGGFFVRYKGGYESFSPAQEFDDGYRRIL